VDATPALPAPPSADLTPAEKALIASAHSDALNISSTEHAEGKLILSALEQSQRILEERHSYPALAALQALVLSEQLQTSRKFIFYFSGETTWNSDARDILRSIVSLANRAGVTICVVNADSFNPKVNAAMEASLASSILGESGGGGLSAAGAVPGAGGASPGAILNSVHVKDISGFESGFGDIEQSPLITLTSGTGGIYIDASSSSKYQLREIHEDLTAWYQASWAPPTENYDGQFRPIEIHSLRKDLVIRARSGYFAVPPTEASGIRPFEMPLLNILAGSTFPTDIAFHAGILHLGALPDGNSGELIVQVPIKQLKIHEDGNTHISSVHASIVAVIKNSKGTILQRFGEDFPLHETPDMFRLDSDQTITLQRDFSADPGVYTLETAVMDRLANKAGSKRTTFTIEPLPEGPSVSDITLVQSIEPVEEDNQTFEPMRYRDGRVVPNLATELPEDTRSLSLFFLLHPLAGSQSQPALRMQIFRNSHLLAEMPMDPRKVSGTGAAIPYLATIHGQVFPPGEYQIKALLSQDGRTASSSASFSVEGSIAASNSPSPFLTVADSATANNGFAIASLTNPLPSPTDAEIQTMIGGARQHALVWSDSLKNFFCHEFTNHFVDATGEGDWKHKGTLVELMKYVDHEEFRSTLMLNGERTSVEPDRLQFAHSTGEFGAMFHVIFDPSAKTTFTWKQAASLDGQPVQVFAFRVARVNSRFDLFDRTGHAFPAGFHGLLYLDPATNTIRRISIDADDIPPTLLIHACSMSVDYAWVSMENHDFLLPVRGAVSLQETQRRPVHNEFEFRDYRRFGSKVNVLTKDELEALSKN
jgi:hypothetical protein